MKILLTGKPKSGKTTLLKSLIENIENKQGFITEEVIKDGVRTGFELISHDGNHAVLASVDSPSQLRVSRYGVNVSELEGFVSNLPSVTPNSLLYIDEIGEMELLSNRFTELVTRYFELPNQLVGTITSVYKDEVTNVILGREDVVLIEVERDTSSAIKDALSAFMTNHDTIHDLSPHLTHKVTAMAKGYVAKKKYIQMKKLFGNAIPYYAKGKLISVTSGHYVVEGNHANHHVSLVNDLFSCDCDLFNGRGNYLQNPGECSHIQTVRLALDTISAR